jgi:2-hydroxy-6-oxonona-2,4-dienedioate hydrolase
MTVKSQNGFAEVGNVRLYYELEGEGPDLVFVHAGCADRRMWDKQLSAFAKKHHVLRYDMRGYGKSTLVKESFSNREDLNQLLEHLNISQAHFVVCSMGSLTTLDFALEHPEKIKSLTLISPAVSGYQMDAPMPQPVADLIAARQNGDFERAADLQSQIWVQGFKRSKDQANPEVYEAVCQMSLDALMLQADIIQETVFLIDEPLNPPAINRLNQVTVPTLIMAGNMDDDTVMAIADLLSTQIDSAQKAVIHGAAHLPNMEKPEEFNQIVLEFLAKIA